MRDHDERTLPVWAQTLLEQQRMKMDALQREHDTMDAASMIIAEHNWFTLSGPYPDEAKKDPGAVRRLWYLSNEGAHIACNLYPGDILLVGRSTKRGHRQSTTMSPPTQYHAYGHYHMEIDVLRMIQSGQGPMLTDQIRSWIIDDAILARREADAMRRAVNKVYWYARNVRIAVHSLRTAITEMRRVLRRMPAFETGADIEMDAVFTRVLVESDKIVDIHSQIPATIYR